MKQIESFKRIIQISLAAICFGFQILVYRYYWYEFFSYQIQLDFWAPPIPPAWGNFQMAWKQLIGNMVNSLITVSVGTLFTVLLSSTSGYVFARLQFPLKNFLFMCMLALMMIRKAGMRRLAYAGCIALAALFIPYAQAGHYMLFSLIITFIVLLLVDMAMLGTGGDISLLGWRLIDTILACGGVLVANLTIRLIALAKQQTASTQN